MDRISLIDDFSHFLYPLILTNGNENSWENAAPEIKFIKESEMFDEEDFSSDALEILSRLAKTYT